MPSIAGQIALGAADGELVARIAAREAELGHVAHALGGGSSYAIAQLGGLHIATSSGGRHRLVFDGELSGIQQLCSEYGVESSGGQARQLVELLARRGVSILSELNGSFALAWIDETEQVARMARDRCGRRPLLLQESEGKMHFASSPNLLPTPAPELDPQHVLAFLSYGAPLGNRCLCMGVRQLEPGVILEIDLRAGVQFERPFASWELPAPGGGRGSDSELRQELVARLEAAVDRVLNGHQRVALALSGGLDSSVLASLLSARDVECRSYNLAVDHGGTNEASAARMMARHVSMPHVELPFRFADFIREWSHSSKTAPHPVGFSEELLVSYIARKAADSEELLITGHGAAELLGGHGAMLRSGDDQMILEQLQENPQLSKEPTLQRFLARARRVYGRPLPSDAFAFLSRRYARSSENLLQDLLGPGFLARAGEPGRVAAPLQSSLNQTVGRDGKERILHFFRTVHLPAQAQVMERACSMGGLPLGTPYLDSELIRFSTQLPIDVLLRWKGELERRAAAGECADDVAGSLDQDRHLLRATFGSQLPRRGAQRRHVPFSAPLSQWFGEEAGQELLREILLDGHLGNDGVFSRPALERKLAEIESAEMRPDRIPLLFRAASLELWHRELVARATQPVMRRATVPAC